MKDVAFGIILGTTFIALIAFALNLIRPALVCIAIGALAMGLAIDVPKNEPNDNYYPTYRY